MGVPSQRLPRPPLPGPPAAAAVAWLLATAAILGGPLTSSCANCGCRRRASCGLLALLAGNEAPRPQLQLPPPALTQWLLPLAALTVVPVARGQPLGAAARRQPRHGEVVGADEDGAGLGHQRRERLAASEGTPAERGSAGSWRQGDRGRGPTGASLAWGFFSGRRMQVAAASGTLRRLPGGGSI
eukprot:SM005776S18586  [mRNA]  locus=s5776:5:839:- [translate_table: standard]